MFGVFSGYRQVEEKKVLFFVNLTLGTATKLSETEK